MDTLEEVERGEQVLRRVLARTIDVRTLDLSGFRRWLNHHLSRWKTDPLFVQRTRIRDLRRAYPELHTLEHAYRVAARTARRSPAHARLESVDREIDGASKAVAGLTEALEDAAPGRCVSLQEKLDAFRAKLQDAVCEREELIRSSPEQQALMNAEEELHRLRAEIGLDKEEGRLDELQRERGRRSVGSGRSFEEVSLSVTTSHLLPDLGGSGDADRVRVLTGVTLGAARTELDQVIVRLPLTPGEPVEVLAIVEVKRNVNDLAHGFRQRQENLAWLTGDSSGYDAAAYRTAHYTSGHFDREGVHDEGGEAFNFSWESFRQFRRDPEMGYFLDRLYFITRPGRLWGLSAAALSRAAHGVATGEGWDHDSEVYMESLLRWCRSLAEPLEAPDVLRLYLTSGRAANVLLAGARQVYSDAESE